jgi:hypothetical protein
VKVGDLVRHPGGDGEPSAIGIIVGRHPEYNWWEVLELCGEYIGCKSEAGPHNGDGWIVISEMPLTEHDRPDTLQG